VHENQDPRGENRTLRADLHLHTVYSDGLFSPEEVARRAREAGVEAVSFTDHDTLENAEEKRAAAEKYGLKYVSGWEISAYDGAVKVHVLGYGCTAGAAYKAFSAKLRAGASERIADMKNKANALFRLSLSESDFQRELLAEHAALHTMHVVRAYAKKLGVPAGELYLNYFAAGKPAYSSVGRPTPEEAVEVIHAMGGIAVLAHPGRIYGDEDIAERLAGNGLDGIECYYTTHTVSDTEYFLSLSKRYGLFVTGGSDFHADDGVHRIGQPAFFMDRTLRERLFPE